MLETTGKVAWAMAKAADEEIGLVKGGMQRGLRLYDFIVNGTFKVALLGAGGVGKSSLIKALVQGDQGAAENDYRITDRAKTIKLDGPMSVTFLDSGGQVDYREERTAAILSQFDSRGRVMLIFASALGYNAYPVSLGKSVVPPSFWSGGQSLQWIRVMHMQQELLALSELLDQLKALKKDVTILTVFTKQDLWYGEAVNARAYYHGRVEPILKEFQMTRRDKGATRLSAKPVSLVHQNLSIVDGDDFKVLAPVSQGYDLSMHAASFSALRAEFDELLGG